MDVLQLPCSIVCEWINDALSLHLVQIKLYSSCIGGVNYIGWKQQSHFLPLS